MKIDKHDQNPRLPLRGIIPPLVTPLHDRDTLDTEGLDRLIEHALSGGVHGLFILGSTGEGPNLSYRLRRELITRTCRQVGHRAPVLVGITDTAFVEAISIARCAAEAGAYAVVTSAPYYFPLGQPELIDFIERLAREQPLPLFLYNMPRMTKTQFEPDTLRRLLHVEKIVGVKDSSGDLAYFAQVLELAKSRPDWAVLTGFDHLVGETIKGGGHGAVAGGAQVVPRLYVEQYDAARAGGWAQVSRLQERVLRLGQIYQVGMHASAFVKAIKCALSLLGICKDVMTEPFSPLGDSERERVRGILGSALNANQTPGSGCQEGTASRLRR